MTLVINLSLFHQFYWTLVFSVLTYGNVIGIFLELELTKALLTV